MSHPTKPDRDDDIDDGDIRALMQESAYGGRMREDFRRSLRRELNQNFVYYQFRARTISVVAVALVAVMAVTVFRATDVGSDAFDLVPTGREVGGVPTHQAPNGTIGVNARNRDDPLLPADELSAEELYEADRAGVGTLVAVVSFTIDGATTTSEVVRVAKEGKKPALVTRTVDDNAAVILKVAKLYTSDSRTILDRINSGTLPPEGTDVVDTAWGPLPMERWSWIDATFGEIIYHHYDAPGETTRSAGDR